ncbi:hypothetical protein E5676_scaffold156G00430 [Cucumis melo var. makuwa]|uniref:NBS-LRR type resistance protein n=1 Tax=Cucumis melo var. makuwa TaxID=1194695 RepID=A0A5D3BJ62_CUCMM|nr:hypothetical protein E5676_scaffold156G00430 [Cucumis melo var. makuwa]
MPKDAHISQVTLKDAQISLVIPNDAHISLVISKDAHISLVIPKDAHISLVISKDTVLVRRLQDRRSMTVGGSPTAAWRNDAAWTYGWLGAS